MSNSARPIRILVADDQADVRSAFRMILDVQPDMTVVAEAADGAAAVQEAKRLRPDVVLADIRMPKLDGLEVTRQLADQCKVIVVTTFDLDEYVHTALRHGAAGFLLKRSGPVLLIEAVRAAMAGDALISPQITVRLLQHMAVPGSSAMPGPAAAAGVPGPLTAGPVEELTEREKEIAELVADGATNAEIGARLFISPGTVKNHLANIQRKLGARNRVGVAAWVWEQAASNR
ncbi:response regulator [Kitasatospora aureofaciens]|uniref:DNA-binding response regulator n=1 Tax=Kitasatospora aureofaciens TaxID=1894 RepID=A0A1E7NA10_KITAU|nr:response regulator transcription factor [Kitasatospora aureofaciens]ARF79045.1 DNA-binding response regulator [Kitasatospora aureofaciens]OEV37526.1 DNA-binding response regulator [Kitasatospora aureofaciens]GGU83232.1 DNA-binding response regulator [Kitasatospora aureofaciens]